MADVRYGILGQTEVAGRPAPGGARLRALLAALAAAPGRAVGTGWLAEAVWGAEPPEDAAGALQALVARLRRALGREAVASGPGGYTLCAEKGDVDLYVFERLAREGGRALAAGDAEGAAARLGEALALWRGPVLADLAVRPVEAARAEAGRLTAQQHRVDAWLALGRAGEAVALTQELVAAFPLNEPFRARQIRALRAAGRDADALAAYDAARKELGERLGADPGPELRALHAELLAGEGPGEGPSGGSGGGPGEAPGGEPVRRRGNLRARLTSFVGREEELRAIRADVERHRLVTLVGAGGAGKTRLAERAGAQLAARWPDGVWVAELAPVDHATGVARAALNAVGRSDTTVFAANSVMTDPLGRLLEHCERRRMLLVLDNCEHVVGAAAELAEALLGTCAGVTVLATSREPLGVRGEAVRPVEPLPPDSARRLFLERAATARPGFDPGTDPEAVEEICRRLDGLPLAIELAAARLRLLGPRQIADRLDDRFRLLTGGSRTALPRQQTLRAVVDWSWELLSQDERAVLRRLSVFAGGCALEAAEAVCAGGEGADVMDLLGALVDKSLVVADCSAGPGDMRFRFLETIHEYVAERAAAHPAELAAAGRAHTAYYRDLVERAAPRLRGADQLDWLVRLETERENVDAALGRVVDAGDERAALAMVTGLGWFWWLRNYRAESTAWVDRVVAMGEPADDEGDPLYWPRMDVRLLRFLITSDQAAAAELRTEEALGLARRIMETYRRPGPQGARFPGLMWPWAGFYLEGMAGVRGLVEDMVANCRAYGGDWDLACALMFRTHMAIDSPGGLAAAEADWTELAALGERSGDRWVRAQVHAARGELAMARGQYASARDDFGISLRWCEELGARGEIPFLTARLGEVAFREGDQATALRHLDLADREAERYGVADVRTYVCLLGGVMALFDGDVRRAREMCAISRAESELGTPPPMFDAALGCLEAGVLRAEGDPVTGLRVAARALNDGVRTACAEPVVAAIVECGARLLVEVGEFTQAARLLGAADALRGELPRSVPETREVAMVERAVCAGLGESAARAARDDGTGLAPEAAADLLDEAAARR